MRIILLTVALVCAWQTTRTACSQCSIQDVRLFDGDGTALGARLFVPLAAARPLPAVVILHGYLANMGFVTVPWVEDLARLGIASLVVDRRGHGRSAGAWWAHSPAQPLHLSELSADVRAAVSFLRDSAPNLDGARLALVGHSDGATAAVIAASADWDVAATVALSASVAPWEYVNHVAPRNLLLLYGADDRFVLGQTDVMLIAGATRGYLRGEGMTGSIADGSARRLLRVPGYGHVDLWFSPAARKETLAWLARSFGLAPPAQLTRQRWPWSMLGMLVLLVLMAFWNGRPRRRGGARVLAGVGWCAALIGVWVGALAAAAAAPPVRALPVREGQVVVAVLAGAGLAAAALLLAVRVAGRWRETPSGPGAVRNGVALAIVLLAATEILLWPLYDMPLTPQRVLLSLFFLAFAVPALVAVSSAATAVGGRDGQVVPWLSVEMTLGVLTAGVAPLWFARMSALPVMLLGFTLVMVGALRMGGCRAVTASVCGAVFFARAAGQVCAFY